MKPLRPPPGHWPVPTQTAEDLAVWTPPLVSTGNPALAAPFECRDQVRQVGAEEHGAIKASHGNKDTRGAAKDVVTGPFSAKS